MTVANEHLAPAPSLLYVVTSLGLGGADQQVRLLARAFRRRGWPVSVVSLVPPDPYPSELVASGVRFETLAMRPGFPDPRAFLRFVRLLKRWRPRIVHGHMVHANLITRLARLAIATPVVISTVHTQHEGGRWRYGAYRLTDGLADLTTAVSGAAAVEHVRRGVTPAHRIDVVPNGIPLPGSTSASDQRGAARAALGIDGGFLWLAAGRFVPAKAYGNLVTAFGRVLESRPGARLLIAGDGPERTSIQHLTDKLGLRDAIQILGVRDDMPTLFRAADAFVMSSDWEGLPMALLEAGAHGLPAIATDVGGCREAVVDGMTGRLVSPGDPEILAGAMNGLMALPDDQRRAMGRAAREHVAARFDLEQIVDAWEVRYRALLALSGGHSHRRSISGRSAASPDRR